MHPSSPLRKLRLASCVPVALLAAACLPASAGADVLTVGSPLSAPATLNTAKNLSYAGINTPVPPNPEAPNGIFHTFHYGADTALWNVASPNGAAMPAAGQATKISLEGCAEPALGGPPPLNQIHFQVLSPLPGGGGVKVELTSQSFEIPVCGVGGASGSTVSTYEPVNMCVARGDYVDFNDEGGYVENLYRNGVPYRILAPVTHATADSFIRGNGTNDGATLSATDTTAMDGFAVNRNEELLLQVQLGTGADARYVCPGGSKDAPAVLAPMRVSPQSDGVNSSRVVSVAIYCRPVSGCPGSASMTVGGAEVGHTTFNLRGNATSHLPIRISNSLMSLIRRRHLVATHFTVTMGGQTFSQTVKVGIF